MKRVNQELPAMGSPADAVKTFDRSLLDLRDELVGLHALYFGIVERALTLEMAIVAQFQSRRPPMVRSFWTTRTVIGLL